MNMGVKRPLEDKNLPELSFKQPKQLDNCKSTTVTTEDFHFCATARVDSPGEANSDLRELDFDGTMKSGDADGALIVHKESDASTPLPSVTSSSSIVEDAGNQDFSLSENIPGYVDRCSIPLQPPEQYVDPYIFLMNRPPRKEIPVGPDHQAEVPEWDPSGKDFPGSNNFVNDEWEQKFMGSCVFPSPGLNDSDIDGFTVGRGRTDCSCLDMGSMRCTQQHVREAREKLREAIGDKTFTKFGFYEMGEEIARKWSSRDQDLFHNVVFSNAGRDFWMLLSTLLAHRTKKELVSYYFNVYMLRRRGIQNRSHLLQIDSDDEGEQGFAPQDSSQNCALVEQDACLGDHVKCTDEGEDEYSKVESFSDQDLDAGSMDEYESEPENVGGDECSNNNCATTQDGHLPKQDPVEMDSVTCHIPAQNTDK